MIAKIDQFEDEMVDMICEESGAWFQIPQDFLPKNKGIAEGSRIKFNLVELPKHTEITENEDFGGFKKNPPRTKFVNSE